MLTSYLSPEQLDLLRSCIRQRCRWMHPASHPPPRWRLNLGLPNAWRLIVSVSRRDLSRRDRSSLRRTDDTT